MCGICGYTGHLSDGHTVLKEMMDAMRHRGPDSDGVYLSGNAGLGFCRLSIIDLEKGSQPLYNEDHTLALVFNGEIYNYQDLRKDLEQKGHVFVTDTDSETLIHGYEQYGEKLLEKLRGMFAFVIWDEKKQKLFGARDFFGIKPFHYAVVDDHLVFASEIKSMLSFPGYQKALNEEAMEQYLSFQYSALEETFFKGIFHLLPGHYLTWEKQKLTIRRYFDPVLTPEQSMDEAETKKSLEETLQMSIRRHMISDVEVGSFLSGGIDSQYVAATFGGDKTFTVGFAEDGKYNEIAYAKELKPLTPVKQYSKVITRDEFLEALPKVMYHLDEPSGDAAAVALYFVAKEASKQVKVVLSGEGADEFFGGYRIYHEPESLKWTRWIPAGIRRGIAAAAKKMPDVRGRDYLIRSGIPMEERYIGNAHIFKTEERRALLKKKTGALSTAQLLKKTYAKMKGLNTMSRMQQADLYYWLPGDILQKADRMSMAHSLEVRVPYLDYDVFALAKRFPEYMKVRGGQTKYLFRETASKVLPQEAAQRPKLGFPVPIRVWIKEEPLLGQIREAFHGPTASEYFQTKVLDQLLDDHVAGKADNSRKIWTVYMFLTWYQVYFGKEISAK